MGKARPRHAWAMTMASYADALDALESNDARGVVRALRSPPKAINTQVSKGLYGGCAIPSGVEHQEGDTLLHMALRNQKWDVRLACVSELGADATVANAQGATPPGMQIQTSLIRFLAIALSSAVLWLDVFSLGFGLPGLIIAGLLCLVSGVDLMLAARWVLISRVDAYVANRPRTTKNTEKAKSKAMVKNNKKR